MLCLKKYACPVFILLLHSVAVSASTDMFYGSNKKDHPLLSESKQKPTLSWEKGESQPYKNPHCLTPSDQGCSNMWRDEKRAEINERMLRHYQHRQIPSEYNINDKKYSITLWGDGD